MNETEIVIVQDALKLTNDGLEKLMTVDNDNVKRIANLLHSALWFGEMIMGSNK